MIAAVNPYISFNGTCEEAFNFYKKVFGGDFHEIHRYKDMPGMEIPESEKAKILHVSLQISEQVWLMGADTSKTFGKPAQFGDNLTITLSTTEEEETRRIYNALSEGGKVSMPLEKTFFADLYGLFTDKFGVCWGLNFIKGKQYK